MQRVMTPVSERFWAKVDQTGECWVWTGAKGEKGYGRLGKPGKQNGWEYAHRVSWRLHFGAIPDGVHVLHRCDNPPCVRPEHLFLGTNRSNIDDKVSKGRSLWGQKHPQAKLTDAQVERIRIRYSAGGVTQSALAAEYGVEQTTISQAIRKRVMRDGSGLLACYRAATAKANELRYELLKVDPELLADDPLTQLHGVALDLDCFADRMEAAEYSGLAGDLRLLASQVRDAAGGATGPLPAGGAS